MINQALGALGALVGLVGAVLSALVLIKRPVVRPGKRVGYRIVHDGSLEPMEDAGSFGIELRAGDQAVREPSLVVVRVENAGRSGIEPDDWSGPLILRFGLRTVIGARVNAADSEELLERISRDLDFAGDSVTVPPVSLNRADKFSLVVLLSGSADRTNERGGEPTVAGMIRGGTVSESASDSTAAKGFTAAVLALLLVSVILLLGGPVRDFIARTPGHCATGHLTIAGSTAFAPVAQEMGTAYRASGCTDARISIAARGSKFAVRDLASAAPQERTERIAMSDGPAPAGSSPLVGRPVAVAIFSIIVNRETGIQELTIEQLRRIFRGEITNWAQIGGSDLQIRIIGRSRDSATRELFEQLVLGTGEGMVTSADCQRTTEPRALVIRCERAASARVLTGVDTIPGAIGYASTESVSRYGERNIKGIALQGSGQEKGYPTLDSIAEGTYPFWATEYLYTAGAPKQGTLTAAFLDYLKSEAVEDILRRNGYPSCTDRGPIARLGQSVRDKLCRLD
jgi:phosphate transport system substrate-binding protein